MAEEESANDPQFLGLVHLAYDTTVFIVRPIGIAVGNILYYVSVAGLFVLRLIWRPLEFLLLPFFYLGNFLLQCLLAPFRFLAKFETLYIYLGIAALVGIAVGLIISLVSGGLQHVLGLDAEGKSSGGRTAKEYREAKRKQKPTNEGTPTFSAGELSPALSGKSAARKKGNKSSKTPTIMEELDSDY